MLKITDAKVILVDLVVIRPDIQICAERAATGTEGKIKNYAPHQDLYHSFDEIQKHIIYDNENDAATIAGHIIEGLNAGLFKLSAP